MNDSMRRLAYLAVRMSYPKDRFRIVSKSYYKPNTRPIDWKFLELINPVPNFASHFLVIDKQSPNPSQTIINIWVKFCSTGNEVGPKTFDGMLTFTKKEFRNILDDKQLFSNITNKDILHQNSISNMIVVASHREGQRLYISKPIFTLDLAKAGDGFYDTAVKQQFKENYQAGDPRKITAGALIRKARDWKVEGVTPYENMGDSFKLWWRISDDRPQYIYPHSLSREEYTSMCARIKPEVFDIAPGVCAHNVVLESKRICFVNLPQSRIAEVYADYMENGKQYHDGLSKRDLTVAQVEWIRKNHSDFPLFPVYHWAFLKNPLYYECLERIN
jgi:hypothetical protein